MSSRLPQATAVAFEALIETLQELGHAQAHATEGSRVSSSARFPGLTFAEVAAERDRTAAAMCALVDHDRIDAVDSADVTAAITDLATSITDHTAGALIANVVIAAVDRTGSTLTPGSPLRRTVIDALEGVACCATDLVAILAYPESVRILAILDAIEDATTAPYPDPKAIAEAMAAYHNALPFGVATGIAFTMFLAHLYRHARLDYTSGAIERTEAHNGLIGARLDVVQWHAAVTADPDTYRHRTH